MPKLPPVELEFKCLNHRGEKVFLFKNSRDNPITVIQSGIGEYYSVRVVGPGKNLRELEPVMKFLKSAKGERKKDGSFNAIGVL